VAQFDFIETQAPMSYGSVDSRKFSRHNPNAPRKQLSVVIGGR
jgi:hypothetical protein